MVGEPSFSKRLQEKMKCAVVFSYYVTSDSFATSWTVACQVPLSMGFCKQEYCSGLPFPSPRSLPNPGTESISLSLAGRLFTTDPSVQFSHSVVSDSLWPHELQHARPPCPSPTPGVHSDSSPLSPWCHPAISASVVPLSSCLQSLPASDSFQWVNSSHEVAKVLEFQL